MTHDSGGLVGGFVDEWRRRTVYGRFWFPLWAASRLFALTILVAAYVTLEPRALTGASVPRRLARGVRGLRNRLPDIYHD